MRIPQICRYPTLGKRHSILDSNLELRAPEGKGHPVLLDLHNTLLLVNFAGLETIKAKAHCTFMTYDDCKPL